MSEKISHGHEQMKAQSFSIQVSTRSRCNGGCLYCISRTTPGIEKITGEIIKQCGLERLEVGLDYAMQLGATHTILTGKADPLQEKNDYLCDLISLSRMYLPLADMHTNGLLLHSKKKAKDLEALVSAGLTMITFSIASYEEEINRVLMGIKRSAADLIKPAVDLGLLVRSSLVMNKQGVNDFDGVMNYIKEAGERGAHQVVIREVWTPESYNAKNETVFQWNQENKILTKPIQDQFFEAAKDPRNKYGLQVRDPLPWGTPVFAVSNIFSDPDHGVNVTFSCCDEATTGSVIKSIVHKPNGHGYRNWDNNGDIVY